MAAAPEVPGVVEACCLPGRQERLDLLLEQLEMCEKALQVCPLRFLCTRIPMATIGHSAACVTLH